MKKKDDKYTTKQYDRDMQALTATLLSLPEYELACTEWLPCRLGMSDDQANQILGRLRKEEQWRNVIGETAEDIVNNVGRAAVTGEHTKILAVAGETVGRLFTLASIAYWYGAIIALETSAIRMEKTQTDRLQAYGGWELACDLYQQLFPRRRVIDGSDPQMAAIIDALDTAYKAGAAIKDAAPKPMPWKKIEEAEGVRDSEDLDDGC